MLCPVTTTLNVTKIAGVFSLGLLTGVSFTLSCIAPSLLLSLPSAPAADAAHRTLTTTTRRLIRTTSIAASTCLALSWLVSPRYRRHPYLLHTALLTWVGGVGVEKGTWVSWVRRTTRKIGACVGLSSNDSHEQNEKNVTYGEERWSGSESNSEDEVVVGQAGEEVERKQQQQDVNGEVVRRKVEAMKGQEGFRTKLLSVAFGMALAGIMGERSRR